MQEACRIRAVPPGVWDAVEERRCSLRELEKIVNSQPCPQYVICSSCPNTSMKRMQELSTAVRPTLLLSFARTGDLHSKYLDMRASQSAKALEQCALWEARKVHLINISGTNVDSCKKIINDAR